MQNSLPREQETSFELKWSSQGWCVKQLPFLKEKVMEIDEIIIILFKLPVAFSVAGHKKPHHFML